MAFSLASTTPGNGRVNMGIRSMLKTKMRIAEIAQVVVRPMNGGNGLHSYTQNSTFQRNGIEAAKKLINKAIAEELDIAALPKTFNVADVGCSVGPNTLMAVQNIVDSVNEKFFVQGRSSQAPDFQVFFSDQSSNDFNELFASLPRDRRYFAAGVPGSFHARLFPDDSLHFVHSSFAAQWLSEVPKEVTEKSSPAWNEGRVYYSRSTPLVMKAFEDQHATDMDNFLTLRAREIVPGGLMALVLPGRRNGAPHTAAFMNKAFEQLESALVDMANTGKISKEKMDSFNIPIYFTSPEEVESIVRKNGRFKAALMEIIPHEKVEPRAMSSVIRAGLEGTVEEHFGQDILEELFDIMLEKFEGSSSTLEACESLGIFVLLKRM